MTMIKRPGLLALALAVVFAFTIGGPLHTFEQYPGDEVDTTFDAALADKPSETLPGSDVIARGMQDAEGVYAGEDALDLSELRAEATDSVVALARSSDLDASLLEDAVGGPTEGEVDAIGGPIRPLISYYTVRRGETLGEIAQRFQISPMTVMASNDLINANTIQAGQELRILSTDGAIHEVKSGESLWEIAQRYRVSIDEIVSVNGISNPNRIRPAQELVIPGTRAAEIGSSIRSERLVSADGRLLPVFDWPVRGRISSNFGMRWGRMHNGMDIAVNTGTPVRASARGRVTFSGMNGGYGYLVTIDHGDGVETRYAHNSRLLVKAGDYVDRGQLIAYSGNTGNSTGPHLHFEIRFKGAPLDPRNYLR